LLHCESEVLNLSPLVISLERSINEIIFTGGKTEVHGGRPVSFPLHGEL